MIRPVYLPFMSKSFGADHPLRGVSTVDDVTALVAATVPGFAAATLDALRQAGQVRLRPILMTTATTVLGLLPMAVSHGEGSELRAPMALTVMGGLIVSTVLTLVIIPVVYSVLDRKR